MGKYRPATGMVSAHLFAKRGNPWVTARDSDKLFPGWRDGDPDWDRYFLADTSTHAEPLAPETRKPKPLVADPHQSLTQSIRRARLVLRGTQLTETIPPPNSRPEADSLPAFHFSPLQRALAQLSRGIEKARLEQAYAAWQERERAKARASKKEKTEMRRRKQVRPERDESPPAIPLPRTPPKSIIAADVAELRLGLAKASPDLCFRLACEHALDGRQPRGMESWLRLFNYLASQFPPDRVRGDLVTLGRIWARKHSISLRLLEHIADQHIRRVANEGVRAHG